MLTIVIRGKHASGKTTVANLIKMFLEESGFVDVKVADIDPLPQGQKPVFEQRFREARARPVRIQVELEGAAEVAVATAGLAVVLPPPPAPPGVKFSRKCLHGGHEFIDGRCAECGGAQVLPSHTKAPGGGR
jgi:hypothetical protein